MKVKMWEIEVEGNNRLCVVANNVKEAITKAMKTQTDWGKFCKNLNEIKKVELLAEED